MEGQGGETAYLVLVGGTLGHYDKHMVAMEIPHYYYCSFKYSVSPRGLEKDIRRLWLTKKLCVLASKI